MCFCFEPACRDDTLEVLIGVFAEVEFVRFKTLVEA